jgi:type II secretory pathway component GspD/PulD (secretin)
MISSQKKYRNRLASLIFSACFAMATPVIANDIPWKSQIYERSYSDADIRSVLGDILKENGLSASFRPDVKGSITFKFNNMSLQAAFNKLINEHNLEAIYDADSRTVTFSAPQRRKLIALAYIKPSQFQVLAKKLLRIDVVGDDEHNIVIANGSDAQLTQLSELAQQLDKAEESRNKALDDSLNSQAMRGTREAEKEVAQLKAEATRRLRDDILNTKTEIIPLKYATVGATTQSFQGQTVTIPGIDETLKNMLGINTSGKGGDAKAGVPGAPAVEEQELARIRREMGQVPPIISIDPRSNSVIVRGSQTAVTEVRRLLEQLDQPLKLVQIEVMIVRARRGVSEQLGVRWGGAAVGSQGGEVNNFGFGVSTGIGSQSLTGPMSSIAGQERAQSIKTDAGTTTTTSGGAVASIVPPVNPFTLLPTSLGGTVASFVFRGTEWALQAQINALAEANKLQTIAAPRVVTLNNLNAKITNDRSMYLETPSSPNAAGTFFEVKAGLTLNITPSLIDFRSPNRTNMVRMAIAATDKDITMSAGRPTVVGNEVQTQVVIPNGSTFVMGGLMNDTRIEGNDGVPGLKDVPIIGSLFKSRSSNSDMQETIFFITPKVVQPDDEFASDVAQRRYLDSQKAKLAEMRTDLQTRSQLIDINPALVEEDE